MYTIELIIFLLAIVTALAEVTDKVKIPYPILLVLTGIAIGIIPGLPPALLDPEIVFLLFLPPILYAAAWTTSWPDFKSASRPITLLAVGCVIFTTCAVAWIAHEYIPGVGWPEAFVLGAIISPPDAIAATAATKGLQIPKRALTILEGESLVNDATGLIAYRYAVIAVVTGAFSLQEAGIQFIVVAAGGITLGLLMGWVFRFVHRITPDNSTTDTTLTIITPFVCYMLAEHLQVSGVLAVVACGLYLSRHSSVIFTQKTRLQAASTWDTIIFILNGVIFILIGLQLPGILESIDEFSLGKLIGYGALISAAVIVVRILWVYPGAYIPRLISKRIREKEPDTNVRLVTLVAWSGMRGVVSLAAALALPLSINNALPFPNRDLIIFITFCVIFSTLVIQGLTLRPLIRILGITTDGQEHRDEQEARKKIANFIIEQIEENYSLVDDNVLNQIKTKYEIRIQRIQKDQSTTKFDDGNIHDFLRVQQELLDEERKMVIQMRKEGRFSDEVLRKIEYELDLEETRLILERTNFRAV